MSVDVGDAQRSTVTFVTSGTASDPTTVTAMLRSPSGTETSQVYGTTGSNVVRDGTGVYHLDVTWSTPGTWAMRWKGTGAVIAAVETTVDAKTSFTSP